jgi:hypothetical protein
MTDGFGHVIVGDDDLVGPDRPTVWTTGSHRHRRQFRHVDFFTVRPTVTGDADITNWIVKRNEETITGD